MASSRVFQVNRQFIQFFQVFLSCNFQCFWYSILSIKQENNTVCVSQFSYKFPHAKRMAMLLSYSRYNTQQRLYLYSLHPSHDCITLRCFIFCSNSLKGRRQDLYLCSKWKYFIKQIDLYNFGYGDMIFRSVFIVPFQIMQRVVSIPSFQDKRSKFVTAV